jgi:hypothetical protein
MYLLTSWMLVVSRLIYAYSETFSLLKPKSRILYGTYTINKLLFFLYFCTLKIVTTKCFSVRDKIYIHSFLFSF